MTTLRAFILIGMTVACLVGCGSSSEEAPPAAPANATTTAPAAKGTAKGMSSADLMVPNGAADANAPGSKLKGK